jgi:hypothetical protein
MQVSKFKDQLTEWADPKRTACRHLAVGMGCLTWLRRRIVEKTFAGANVLEVNTGPWAASICL